LALVYLPFVFVVTAETPVWASPSVPSGSRLRGSTAQSPVSRSGASGGARFDLGGGFHYSGSYPKWGARF